ncbi:MAG TPA: hypothetical protein PLK34_00625 [Candidatus Pacearchaeota archaeon]|nr:hypothetical protein [Candidatus Pacearchaeota archaeon]
MPKKASSKKAKKAEKTEEKAEKVKLSAEEFEKKVIELAKEGLTSEKIGEKLRKQGIHSKEYNKKISKILKEKNLYKNPDLKNIEEKLGRIDNHYARNKQDKKTLKSRERIQGKLRQLKNYFSRQSN